MSRDARLQKFFETAMERQIIYAQKELGCPKPWSQDKQFNTWFFCNVFRTQDKVTKWIITHIIDKYQGDPDLWKKIIVARRLSRIESMEAVEKVNGYEDLEAGMVALMKMREMKIPYLTNAFITGKPKEGIDRIAYLYELIQFYTDRRTSEKFHGTLKEAFDALNQEPDVGPFMCYETVTDFSYSQQYLLHAEDKYTWANTGPGCLRGINLIEHGDVNQKIVKADRGLMVMRRYLEEWKAFVSDTLPSYTYQAVERCGKGAIASDYMRVFLGLDMRSVEHWLCEFDKHERIGRNKREYP